MTENTRKKMLIIEKIISENYQPGRQDRCKRWVLRNYVARVIPMSERTFYEYIRRIEASSSEKLDDRDTGQLRLFDD